MESKKNKTAKQFKERTQRRIKGIIEETDLEKTQEYLDSWNRLKMMHRKRKQKELQELRNKSTGSPRRGLTTDQRVHEVKMRNEQLDLERQKLRVFQVIRSNIIKLFKHQHQDETFERARVTNICKRMIIMAK